MRIHHSYRYTLVALLALGLAVVAFAQCPTPPLPYTAPDYPAVLAGKAPLRVLVASCQAMLAWKGDGAVRISEPAAKTALYTAPAAEVVGIKGSDDGATGRLRKNNADFREAPGVVRLDSDKPIKLWTEDPNTWTTYPYPVVITRLEDGSFSAAVEVPLEEYLRDVLPAEVLASFHPQMMRAQAIVARTYALCKLGRHAEEGADVCASEHCQVYKVGSTRTANTDAAVAATKGLILLWRDKLAEPYYHSTCGGITDDAGYVWGPEYARRYLTGITDFTAKKPADDYTVREVLAVQDAYCAKSRSYHWERKYTAAEVNALVTRNLPLVTGDARTTIRTVRDMSIEERTPFGRVSTLRVEGDGTSVLVYGDAARWLFGDGVPSGTGLWSSLFDLAITRDAAGRITGYTITGAGRGHGIGMCQWGAEGRARAGHTFRDIIKAYYPGTRLSDEKK